MGNPIENLEYRQISTPTEVIPEVYFKSIIWCSEYIRETTLGCSGKAYFSHTVSQVSPSGTTEKSTEEPRAKKKKKFCRRVNSAEANFSPLYS